MLCGKNQKPKVVLIEPHNIGREDAFYTTILFWDCECEHDYIHPCTEEVVSGLQG